MEEDFFHAGDGAVGDRAAMAMAGASGDARREWTKEGSPEAMGTARRPAGDGNDGDRGDWMTACAGMGKVKTWEKKQEMADAEWRYVDGRVWMNRGALVWRQVDQDGKLRWVSDGWQSGKVSGKTWGRCGDGTAKLWKNFRLGGGTWLSSMGAGS